MGKSQKKTKMTMISSFQIRFFQIPMGRFFRICSDFKSQRECRSKSQWETSIPKLINFLDLRTSFKSQREDSLLANLSAVFFVCFWFQIPMGKFKAGVKTTFFDFYIGSKSQWENSKSTL